MAERLAVNKYVIGSSPIIPALNKHTTGSHDPVERSHTTPRCACFFFIAYMWCEKVGEYG